MASESAAFLSYSDWLRGETGPKSGPSEPTQECCQKYRRKCSSLFQRWLELRTKEVRGCWEPSLSAAGGSILRMRVQAGKGGRGWKRERETRDEDGGRDGERKRW